MRGLALVVVVVLAGTAYAEPGSIKGSAVCPRVAIHVTKVIGAQEKVQTLVARRCDKDRWSRDAQACFGAAATSGDAQRCIDKLSKEQRKTIEGDADRLGDPRFQQWLARRTSVARAPLPPPNITLAVLTTDAPDIKQARLLHTQGLSAYQAGRYDFAIRKFSAALDTNPTPELVYHAAQAYRLKGDRAKALELYEQYLDLAPRGAAANDCQAQIEKLRPQL